MWRRETPSGTCRKAVRGTLLRSRQIQRRKERARAWHSKAKASEVRGMKLRSFAKVRFSLTLKMFPQPTDRVPKKSGSAHMKSIWNVAHCQARNLMIGCKPNANSSLGRRESSGIFDPGRGSMKRRDFIKDIAVSALALRAPSQ